MNGDDWGFDAPENADGYHASSEMGGIGIDLYSWGGGSGHGDTDGAAGSSNGTIGVVADFGDMGGFASISVGFWGYDKGDTFNDFVLGNDGPDELPGTGDDVADTGTDVDVGVTAANTNIVINIDNIGGDNLMGVDLDIEWASSGADDLGAEGFLADGATEDGSMTTISASYALGDMGMTLHVSNSKTDEFWRSSVSDPHGTHGIADLFNGADLDNTTMGLSFSPMDGVDASVNFITIGQDSTGDNIGNEIDIVIRWACGADTDMLIGWASYSDDGGFSALDLGDDGLPGGTGGDADTAASGIQDSDFFYIQTGWDF
jgi:hypothetical protein